MYTYIHIKICIYSVEPPSTRVCVCGCVGVGVCVGVCVCWFPVALIKRGKATFSSTMSNHTQIDSGWFISWKILLKWMRTGGTHMT